MTPSPFARALYRNTVCIQLAEELYYAHAAFHTRPVPLFDALSPEVKHLWVERAQTAILTVETVTTVTH